MKRAGIDPASKQQRRNASNNELRTSAWCMESGWRNTEVTHQQRAICPSNVCAFTNEEAERHTLVIQWVSAYEAEMQEILSAASWSISGNASDTPASAEVGGEDGWKNAEEAKEGGCEWNGAKIDR